jgi:DNA methylase
MLATLPDASVQCCVTSPPYLGLRDYGTAQWDGGDAECDHLMPPNGVRDKGRDRAASGGTFHDSPVPNQIRQQFAGECRKCGARRIDAQIGLEATPDEYIAQMVAVFREVRRVLRDDGVCFVNMGDSYAGSQRATAYGKGDTEPASSIGGGCLCGSLCDGCRKAYRIGRFHSDNPHAPTLVASTASSNRERMAATRDHAPTSGFPRQHDRNSAAMPDPALVADHADAQPLDALASTTIECEPPPPAECLQSGTQDGECLSCGRSLADCAPASAGMVACTCDTEGGAWARHTTGTASSGLAYPGYTTASPKPKDLMMMPARVALALQADGWFLRSQMPWIKRSCMPESTTDRPTSAIEYVYLLTKSPRYFFDAQAVAREGAIPAGTLAAKGSAERAKHANGRPPEYAVYSGTRNFRNSDLFFDSLEPPYGMILSDGEPLALDVNPAAFADAHFATFPPGLVEPLIRAGTSERGCCAACGAPWVRRTQATGGILGQAWGDHADDLTKGNASNGRAINRRTEEPYQRTTTGWAPTCKCDAPTVPCTVLDCFAGAATTLVVADRLQRRAIGIELNADYIAMARRRIEADAGMFAEVEAA